MSILRWTSLFAATVLVTSPAAWALDHSIPAIGADPASLATVGIRGIDGTGVRIGQIESGNPLTTHAALAGHVTVVNDPANPAANTTDHATNVAGVMVSQGGAGADAAKRGVAPGAQISSFALSSNSVGGIDAARINGGDTLVARGVSIVNESNSTNVTPTDGSNRATLGVDWFAYNRNLIWVQTPGNRGGAGGRIGSQTINVPGDCFNCITVGATGPSPTFNQVAAYSPEGRTSDLRNKPDIVAPGSDISMPTTPNGFESDSGTSFAAPHVAGVAALLLQFARTAPKHPNGMDHRVIKAVLLNSASKDGVEANTMDGYNKPGEIRVTRKDGRLWAPVTPGRDSLDDNMGAGEVNARAAFKQFNRPEATTMSPAPGTNINFSVDPIAWDFNHVYVGNYDQYNINRTLAKGSKLTATLIWDRHVTRTPCAAPGCNHARDDTFTASALSNLNLDLYENGTLLQTFDAQGRASFSDSTVDSVEHIYFTLPNKDDYSLRVTDVSGTDELFGFAVWAHPAPEPATILLLLPGLGLLALRGRKAATRS